MVDTDSAPPEATEIAGVGRASQKRMSLPALDDLVIAAAIPTSMCWTLRSRIGTIRWMSLSYETVHIRLLDAIPEFCPAVEEHVADHGEVLQHVLFGDLTRFVLAAKEAGDPQLVLRVLRHLDSEMRLGDEKVQELVAVSFVENVGPWEDAMSGFVAAWPVALRQEAERERRWTPDAG